MHGKNFEEEQTTEMGYEAVPGVVDDPCKLLMLF